MKDGSGSILVASMRRAGALDPGVLAAEGEQAPHPAPALFSSLVMSHDKALASERARENG